MDLSSGKINNELLNFLLIEIKIKHTTHIYRNHQYL
jgi:hypothetical protein